MKTVPDAVECSDVFVLPVQNGERFLVTVQMLQTQFSLLFESKRNCRSLYDRGATLKSPLVFIESNVKSHTLMGDICVLRVEQDEDADFMRLILEAKKYTSELIAASMW